MKRQSKTKINEKSTDKKPSTASNSSKIAKNVNVVSKRQVVPTNSKPLNRISKPPLKKKPQIVKEIMGWGKIPPSFLLSISKYACSSLIEIYNLSMVCTIWRYYLRQQDGFYFWNELPSGDKIPNFKSLILFLEKYSIQLQQKRSFQFEKLFVRLFEYGSTKQNIPNKLITKLDLDIQVKINNLPYKSYPYKLRNFNFSSYLFTKINDINQFKYDFTTPHNMFKDNLTIEIKFYSKRYKVYSFIKKKYCPQQLVQCAIKQKAFNFFIDKNSIFTFFEGDNNFLYFFFEISVLELINNFRKTINDNNKQSLKKNMKNVPKYKQLSSTQFQDFVQYIKFQSDFQLHMSYHNSIKQIFTHCDTKVFPIDYDSKHAYFEVKINDSFEKQSTFNLDNKMGMSQNIPNLYLLDFVLKDRDKFLIVFSGFIYARKLTLSQREQIEDYWSYNEMEIKILQYKQPKYNFAIIIIEQGKRNLMKFTRFNLYP